MVECLFFVVIMGGLYIDILHSSFSPFLRFLAISGARIRFLVGLQISDDILRCYQVVIQIVNVDDYK